jgi:hypothetical protein
VEDWAFPTVDKSPSLRTAALVFGALIQHPALDSLSARRALRPAEETAAVAGDLIACFGGLC